MSATPKIISAEEVENLLKPSELLDAIETALGNFSLGEDGGVVQPMRSVVPVDKHHGFLGLMPAYSTGDDSLAVKLVAFYPENKTFPTHQAWVMYYEPSNGSLLAIIDGESITGIRTALASAVATKHLANPNSRVLAILGSGIQARSHYRALRLLQSFDEVRVWSRTHSNAKKFASEIGAQLCETPEEAVTGADIICTVTFATTPIVQGKWIKEGAHINAVGACRAYWHELDSELMNKATVYVDTKEGASKEAGDIVLSQCEVYGEIGEVIVGQKQAFWEKTTVFKSVGMAIEDVITAKMVYEKYMQNQSPP